MCDYKVRVLYFCYLFTLAQDDGGLLLIIILSLILT